MGRNDGQILRGSVDFARSGQGEDSRGSRRSSERVRVGVDMPLTVPRDDISWNELPSLAPLRQPDSRAMKDTGTMSSLGA